MFASPFAPNTCRLCATPVTSNPQPIFADPEGTPQLSNVGVMMRDCLFGEIDVQMSDYPNVVCQYCQLQLNVFYEFKRKVLEHHRRFTDMILEARAAVLQETVIKDELTAEEEQSVPMKSPEFVDEHYLDDEETDDIASVATETRRIKDEDYDDDDDDDDDDDNYLQPPSDVMTRRAVDEDETHEPADALEAARKLCYDSAEYDENEEYEPKDLEIADDAMTDIISERSLLEPPPDAVSIAAANEEDDDDDSDQLEMLAEYIDESDGSNEDEPAPAIDNNADDGAADLPDGMLKLIPGSIVVQSKGNWVSALHCSVCREVYLTRRTFQAHIRHKHRFRVQCKLCGVGLFSDHVHQHMRKHRGVRPFACRQCTACFSTNSQRLAHEFRHTNQRPVECAECGKTFKLKCDLRVHMDMHRAVRRYECDMCDKTFRMHSHLSDHRQTHNTLRTLPCDQCGLLFKTTVTLRSHQRQMHSADLAFKCAVCKRGFFRRHKLERHMRGHERRDAKFAAAAAAAAEAADGEQCAV